jgi:hypothetical protein
MNSCHGKAASSQLAAVDSHVRQHPYCQHYSQRYLVPTCLKAEHRTTTGSLTCVYVGTRVCAERCIVYLFHQWMGFEEVCHSSSIRNTALHPQRHLHARQGQQDTGASQRKHTSSNHACTASTLVSTAASVPHSLQPLQMARNCSIGETSRLTPADGSQLRHKRNSSMRETPR